MFGTWNLLSTVVRVYAGVYIDQQAAYDLAILTFVIALMHSGWEWQVEGTVGGFSLLAGEVTPIATVAWMVAQRAHYIQ